MQVPRAESGAAEPAGGRHFSRAGARNDIYRAGEIADCAAFVERDAARELLEEASLVHG